ncbi:MAG: peptidase M28, partial [Flavobacteriaceae bacterium]|nr:peptidase M28 [Flavobacteriaceae bacterium]
AILSLWVLLKQEKPNLFLMVFLAIPALFLFAPLIQFFPVGLGLKMIVLSSVFTVLLFGLLLSVTRFYKMKKTLSYLSFILAALFFISAHTKSDFSEERQKPNSLMYYQDANSQEAYWFTYDKVLDEWTKEYLGETPEKASMYNINTEKSKYNTGYSFVSEAPKKEIPLFETILNDDTIIDSIKEVRFTIKSKRNINQISLYADTSLTFQSLAFNGKNVPKDSSGYVFSNRKDEKLLRYYVADGDSLEVRYSIEKEIPVSFTVLEYSFDLLENNQFTINKRPKHTMPKPFVITDAIVIKNTIDINSLTGSKNDSLKPQTIE